LDLQCLQTELGFATLAGRRRMRNVERGVTKNVQVAGAGARDPEAKLPNVFLVWFFYQNFLLAGHLCFVVYN